MTTEFKLKLQDNPNDIPNGHKVEVDVDGIEGGKVLLLKVNGTLRALNPRCTHYGAPLVKGVVTGDGRITCPWHGACFHIDTGDIENAPALDYLNSFPVQVRNSEVFITASEEKIKSGRRRPEIQCKAVNTGEHVVVVGGGSGAIGAIESLREKGFTGLITCISKEPYYPIDRTRISKALATDLQKLQWRDSEFFKNAGVDFRLGTTVSEVDFNHKKVKLEDGQEVSYTKVILATGGTPKRLPIEGFNLGNVFLLRGVDDARAIVEAVGDKKDKKIVVIGSSFIGMELGNYLANQKNDVTIIGMESAPLERVMGAQIGQVFQKLVTSAGAKFKMSASVERATPSVADPTKVGGIQLKFDEIIPADLVILGVGVTPETRYIKDESLLLKDKSLEVDDHYRVKGVQDAYAVGDIASYPYKGPGAKEASLVRIEHWNVAQGCGRLVGAHIAKGEKPTSFIPIFWSALGVQLRYCGNTMPRGYDDIVVQGNLEEAKFIAFYTLGEIVVAVASMQKDPAMAQAAELMRRGGMLTKSELKAGGDIMKVDVTARVAI
ncbi:hypothetical protein L211DRAFT_783205 [Terfezia boudieri ATCC MYA-4762]|uniref:Rieske domain-containing protein n=1 Tax=Terfezia boudieri ATCC MYA-4762 TaxID=1051890 RepID=A0A3N4LUD2_9PEZI|nr:hypothetical protein L211DRAFT_783205 [Terfezia boudieri ATCC MYA-4762]